jgi:hypothetical protein
MLLHVILLQSISSCPDVVTCYPTPTYVILSQCCLFNLAKIHSSWPNVVLFQHAPILFLFHPAPMLLHVNLLQSISSCPNVVQCYPTPIYFILPQCCLYNFAQMHSSWPNVVPIPICTNVDLFHPATMLSYSICTNCFILTKSIHPVVYLIPISIPSCLYHTILLQCSVNYYFLFRNYH